MKILLSHPMGNANVRAALSGLSKIDLLHSFHTCIAEYPNNIWGKLSKFSLLREFHKRSFPSHLSKLTHTYPISELGRMMAVKLNWKKLITHETGLFSVDKVYQKFDLRVANYLNKQKDTDAVYAYEDGALTTFITAKKNGLKCIYDLPIGYWRSMHRLLADEKEKNPGWAMTLGGFSDSQEKLHRKDQELKFADQIYVASSFTKKTLEEYPDSLGEIKVIPYGFPPANTQREYQSLEGRKLKLLYVGGLSQRKGLSYLFDAVENLQNDVELTVVGRGNIEGCPALKNALNRHTYIPSLPHHEILELMAKQDVFVFPSLFEGFGLVITEAMSQGTPVITTERTCGPDVIEHNKSGWLVKAGDKNELQKIIEFIVANPSVVESVGKEAILAAKKRPWDSYGEELSQSIIEFLEYE